MRQESLTIAQELESRQKLIAQGKYPFKDMNLPQPPPQEEGKVIGPASKEELSWFALQLETITALDYAKETKGQLGTINANHDYQIYLAELRLKTCESMTLMLLLERMPDFAFDPTKERLKIDATLNWATYPNS